MLGSISKKKMKEKLIDKSNDEQFIFYNVEKKFQQQLEIQTILNWNTNYKVLVIIDSKSTIEYLCVKIAENLDQFQEFTGLEGLKACNLTKKTEIGDMSIPIPSSGALSEYLNDGDIIYCDLTTEAYWIKTTIKLHSIFSTLAITLDIKFRLDATYKKIKLLLIKCGLNFWIDYLKQMDNHFHFTISDIKFKTISKSKNNIEFNLSEENALSHLKNIKVEDMFDFNSEVQCTIHFGTLEELMYNELLQTEVANSQNKLRWDEFRDTSFEQFLNDKKFAPEVTYIKKYLTKLFKHPKEPIEMSCYLYNSDNSSDYYKIIEDEGIMKIDEVHPEYPQTLVILPDYTQESISKVKAENPCTMIQSEINIFEVKRSKTQADKGDIKKEEEEDKIEEDNKEEDITVLKRSSLQNFERVGKKVDRKKTGTFAEPSSTIDKLNPENEAIVIQNVKRGSAKEDSSIAKPNSLDMRVEEKLLRDTQRNGENEDHEEALAVASPRRCDDKSGYPRTISQSKASPQHERLTLFLSKIRDTSTYSNLCGEFCANFKEEAFISRIGAHYRIYLAKGSLEKEAIPQFRNLVILPKGIQTEEAGNPILKDEMDEPIRVSNRNILCFISGLFLIFISAILVLFLYF